MLTDERIEAFEQYYRIAKREGLKTDFINKNMQDIILKEIGESREHRAIIGDREIVSVAAQIERLKKLKRKREGHELPVAR